MIKRLLIGLASVMAFAGCKKYYAIPEPSYVQIDTYTMKVAPTGQQGTADQDFTDMQIIANGTTYGIFPLGTKVPILVSGDAHFLIKAVVEINGVNALRSAYAEMKGCDTIINTQLGKVTRIVPEFQYFSSATFPLLMDFENTSYGSTNTFIVTN